MRLKRDGTRAETRFRLLPKRTGPFKSAGASVQSTAGSQVLRISVSNAGYTTLLKLSEFWGVGVKVNINVHFMNGCSGLEVRLHAFLN